MTHRWLKPAVLIAYRALSDSAGKGSLFLITLLAARRLGGRAFGVFALGSTSGWMLAVATDFGIQLHVARAVAWSPDRAHLVLRRWLPVRAGLSVAAIGAAAIGVRLAPGGDRLPLFLLVVAYVLSGLVEFLYYFYRGLDRSDLESSLTLGHRLALLAAGMAVLLWHPDLDWLAAVMLLPVAGALVIGLAVAFRLRAPHPSRVVCLTDRRPVAVEFARDVLPIGAGIVLSAVYFRVDLFLIGLWKGAADAGLYNAAFRLVEALRLFPAAVLAVTLPSLVRAGDHGPLLRVAGGVTLFGAAVTLAGWTASDWLIPLLYGPRYADAVPAFRILMWSFPLLSLNYALTHQLIGWRGQRAYVATCAAALILNLALNARLVPAWGLTGAAWATFCTEALVTAGCLWGLRGAAPRPIAPRQPAVVAS